MFDAETIRLIGLSFVTLLFVGVCIFVIAASAMEVNDED